MSYTNSYAGKILVTVHKIYFILEHEGECTPYEFENGDHIFILNSPICFNYDISCDMYEVLKPFDGRDVIVFVDFQY